MHYYYTVYFLKSQYVEGSFFMFYATYKSAIDDCSFDEIAEFQTKQERDDWVSSQDSIFEREAIDDLEFLEIDLTVYLKVPMDTFVSNAQWYIKAKGGLNNGN